MEKVLSVSEAREGLPQLLATLVTGESGPVRIGAHRKPQVILMSVAQYEGLGGVLEEDEDVSERRKIVASSIGSLRAEGLEPSEVSKAFDQAYVRGEITPEQVVEKLVEIQRRK